MLVLRFVVLAVLGFYLAGCGGEDAIRNDLPVRCLDEPESGPCRARVIRYYYDYSLDRCSAFHYGGCQGRVPFETLDACEETCVGGSR